MAIRDLLPGQNDPSICAPRNKKEGTRKELAANSQEKREGRNLKQCGNDRDSYLCVLNPFSHLSAAEGEERERKK